MDAHEQDLKHIPYSLLLVLISPYLTLFLISPYFTCRWLLVMHFDSLIPCKNLHTVIALYELCPLPPPLTCVPPPLTCLT
jgi:hypothetical protein